ncbi:MAG: alpha/beta hydrolase family protein [Candidatus Firestonebacteria bacterium]
MKRYFDPGQYHEELYARTERKLEFKPGMKFEKWKAVLMKKLTELTGYEPPEKAPLKVTRGETKEFKDYVRQRLVFNSEAFADVPAYLLIPKGIKGRMPAMVCLQGHTKGFHISIGEPVYPGDAETIKGGRDFAVQAVKQGFVALALEQRCFGERKKKLQSYMCDHPCTDAALHSFMLGKTMIAERVRDAQRGLDLLESLPFVDKKRLGCMGNSGGGTITFYASIFDKRIKLGVPSCTYCTFKDSLMNIWHCVDNYIPGILKYAEMGDLAGLRAPGKLLIVSGKEDKIFPLKGVKEAFKRTEQIYSAAGARKNLELLIGPEGHRFYPKQAWPLIKEMINR